MPDALRSLQRAINAARRLAHGLRLRAENVSPECANDLFQAHAAIYHFAASYTRDRRVLDLGCGTGYGSARLLAAGARSVLGLDLDPANVRYAGRRFQRPGLRFEIADAERLSESWGTFQAVIGSNVFEHLTEPAAALEQVRGRLEPGGILVLAVPPIVDRASLEENLRNPFHRSNFHLETWLELLTRRFETVRTFHQFPPAGVRLDFSSPFRSKVRPETFRFEEVSPGRHGSAPTLTALFVST